MSQQKQQQRKEQQPDSPQQPRAPPSSPLRGGSNAGASSDSLITPLSIAAATAASAASIAASASMVALAVASPAPVIDSETVYSLGDASVTLQPTSKSAKIATKKNGKAPPSPGKTSSSHEKRTNKTKGENANANATDSSNGKNANHLHDTIQDGTVPVPPGPKRHRLDPNKAPGMPLDNKDSHCGRLLPYMTGGSHPTNLSGTYVPGIRMDGATEGEYPPGLFSQKGASKSLKAFVNCFAGYFQTMGGCIPPCPGDCPPTQINLNENSNKANPLKKTAYEYPWSIRAGFLPERIEAFELMEDDQVTKNKASKKAPPPTTTTTTTPTTSNTAKTRTAEITTSATSKAIEGREARESPPPTPLAVFQSDARSQNQSDHNDNNNRSSDTKSAGNDSIRDYSTTHSLRDRSSAHSARSTGFPPSMVMSGAEATSHRLAPLASLTGSDEAASAASAATPGTGSLWRDLQQQRREQRQQQRQPQQREPERQRDMNKNQNCEEKESLENLDKNSDIHLSRPTSLTSRVLGYNSLVDRYRDQIEAKLCRTRVAMMSTLGELPSIHQELRVRRTNSHGSCRSNKSSAAEAEAEAEESTYESIGGARRSWRPKPASGML